MSAEETLDLRPACMKLRHRLMYVDERQGKPGLVDDSDDTTVFFCLLSQDPIGPDGEPVSPTECTPGRGCYCPPPTIGEPGR